MPPLQYVILRHEGIPEPHFDLMFETFPGSQLATWRSEQWPIESPIALTRLKEHRRIFLEYEGDLTHGRGRVIRMARGACQLEVGENAVWTISLDTGSSPRTLRMRQIAVDRWEGTSV